MSILKFVLVLPGLEDAMLICDNVAGRVPSVCVPSKPTSKQRAFAAQDHGFMEDIVGRSDADRIAGAEIQAPPWAAQSQTHPTSGEFSFVYMLRKIWSLE